MDIERAEDRGGVEERWAACFQGPDNEPYLLVRGFNGGDESSVQLLIHQNNGKLVVRKIPHSVDDGKVTITLVTATHIDIFGEGNEIQMVKYLAPFARRDAGFARIYQFIASRTIEVTRADGLGPQATGENLIRAAPGSGQFLRESFWGYCNIGSLDDLAQLYQDRLTYPPPSLVARIIHQVLSGLHFMLCSGRGVEHRDLHTGNVLANFATGDEEDFLPNMLIADFGDARFVGKDASDRVGITRDMILTDAKVFSKFLIISWFFPPDLANDARFAALVRKLEHLYFQDLPGVVHEARLLEIHCLVEEGADKIESYPEMFKAHQKQKPCVAKIWPSKAIAQLETRELAGPFELIQLPENDVLDVNT